MGVTDAEVIAVASSHSARRWDESHLVVSLNSGPSGGLGVVIPLPSSSEPEVWLYAPPEDAADWWGQLATFLTEELDTGAAEWALQVEDRGYRLLLLAPYGLRRRDDDEHERLLAAAGRFGWHRDEGGRLR